MDQNQELPPSSPLSSVPEDLQTPESWKYIVHKSKDWGAPTSDNPGFISDGGGWDETTFKDGDIQMGRPSESQAPASPQSPHRQGFAQSDLDAAVAASLSDDTRIASRKRKRKVDNAENAKNVGHVDVTDNGDDVDAREDADNAEATPTRPSRTGQKPISGAAKANAARRRTMLYTSHKSPLTKINLTKLLRLPEAWRVLTWDQQRELAAMLPDKPDVGGEGPHDSLNVLADALMNNAALRTDVREWHEGLAAGMEDPDWRDEAAEAMEKRARGEIGTGKWWVFDEHVKDYEDGTPGLEADIAWWKDPSLVLT